VFFCIAGKGGRVRNGFSVVPKLQINDYAPILKTQLKNVVIFMHGHDTVYFGGRIEPYTIVIMIILPICRLYKMDQQHNIQHNIT
jgi:hypothetical protein